MQQSQSDPDALCVDTEEGFLEHDPSSPRPSTEEAFTDTTSTSISESHINELIMKVSGGKLSLSPHSNVTWEEYEKVQLQLHQANRDIRYYQKRVKDEQKKTQ